jgi:hypothetical protein
MTPYILNPTRSRSVLSLMPQLFYNQVKSPHYPLDRRKVGPQGQTGYHGEKKNLWRCQEMNTGQQWPPYIWERTDVPLCSSASGG